MKTLTNLIGFLRRQPRWRFVLALAIVAVGVWFVWKRGAGSAGSIPTFVARRGPLEITVLEGGSLQALESQEIKCEVRVGYQGTKILRIVEQGYLVTKDEIKLQVRDRWRSLDQAKRNYEISEIGVKLAERRVEEQNLFAELGRAMAQDQVDAQDNLVNSKNQRTEAPVDHTVARLRFWDNVGILFIKENGQWQEVSNVRELKTL